MGPDGKHTFTVEMKCCRVWPIDPYSPIGRCGYCGEKPVIIPKSASEDLNEH